MTVLRVPMCQMIVVRRFHSILLICAVQYSLLALISSVHVDKVLAWLSFRKIYVLKTSFSKNLPQINDKNYPSNYKLAQWILRHTFPSQYKCRRFWNVNFALPKISPSKMAFEKDKPWELFSKFYGIFQNAKYVYRKT